MLSNTFTNFTNPRNVSLGKLSSDSNFLSLSRICANVAISERFSQTRRYVMRGTCSRNVMNRQEISVIMWGKDGLIKDLTPSIDDKTR